MTDTFEVQLPALRTQLESRAERVRACISRSRADVKLAIDTSVANPGTHLSATDVRRRADLGLAIDFDIDGPPDARDSDA